MTVNCMIIRFLDLISGLPEGVMASRLGVPLGCSVEVVCAGLQRHP
jgi:hypothetical protein